MREIWKPWHKNLTKSYAGDVSGNMTVNECDKAKGKDN